MLCCPMTNIQGAKDGFPTLLVLMLPAPGTVINLYYLWHKPSAQHSALITNMKYTTLSFTLLAHACKIK